MTVFCPPEPRVGAFIYRNAGKVYILWKNGLLKDILLKAKLQSGGLDYRAGTRGTAVLLLSTNFLKLFVQCI